MNLMLLRTIRSIWQDKATRCEVDKYIACAIAGIYLKNSDQKSTLSYIGRGELVEKIESPDAKIVDVNELISFFKKIEEVTA